MIDPNDIRVTTRRETITWVAVACLTLTGRYIARQLAARRPVWAVLAFAFAVGAGALAWRGQDGRVGNPYTFGPSRVEAASEAATPTANPLLQRGYVTPMPGGATAIHDDPMVPLLPMMDAAAPGGPDDGTPPTWLPAGLAPWWLAIVAAAHEHGLDSHAWGAIVAIECPWGDANCGSQAGAKGLAQIMDGTAVTIQAQSGLPCSDRPFDGATSLRCGAFHFADLLRQNADLWRAGDELPALLAAAVSYNAGPGAQPRRAVRDAATTGGDLCAGVAFAETASYCRRYREMWQASTAERMGPQAMVRP